MVPGGLASAKTLKLSRLFLVEGGNPASGGNADIFGTQGGAEELTTPLGDMSQDSSFNAGGDTLTASLSASDFTAQLSGSSVLLDSDTTDIAIPVGETGMMLSFADASLDAILIGRQTIGTDPMPLIFA